jgi:hypothetical protein
MILARRLFGRAVVFTAVSIGEGAGMRHSTLASLARSHRFALELSLGLAARKVGGVSGGMCEHIITSLAVLHVR